MLSSGQHSSRLDANECKNWQKAVQKQVITHLKKRPQLHTPGPFLIGMVVVSNVQYIGSSLSQWEILNYPTRDLMQQIQALRW